MSRTPTYALREMSTAQVVGSSRIRRRSAHRSRWSGASAAGVARRRAQHPLCPHGTRARGHLRCPAALAAAGTSDASWVERGRPALGIEAGRRLRAQTASDRRARTCCYRSATGWRSRSAARRRPRIGRGQAGLRTEGGRRVRVADRRLRSSEIPSGRYCERSEVSVPRASGPAPGSDEGQDSRGLLRTSTYRPGLVTGC